MSFKVATYLSVALAIAAHAIALGLIVVTADAALERLGIRRENWLR